MSKTAVERDHFKCWLKIAVRWGDMDALGHLNNAAFFTYCESGRIEYFDQITLGDFSRAAEGPALVHAELNFRRQVHYPAVLDVGVTVPRISRSSFSMNYGIFFEATDTLVADGTSVVVWTDYAAGRAKEIPDRVRRTIELLEGRESLA